MVGILEKMQLLDLECLAPSEGLPRNVTLLLLLYMLYPPGKESRIPIIAVTGTNGKTTTTRLLAHIVKK
jgi:cyanophycin synthetase